MLEVTTEAQEEALGVDFAAIYKNSDQSRYIVKWILSFNVLGLTITCISSSYLWV